VSRSFLVLNSAFKPSDSMIDLHTHTTASDGRLTPAELVARAAAAGVTVISATDHDTTAAHGAMRLACAAAGIEFVPGIEITAIRDGVDVHVLGYFVESDSPELLAFLAEQRTRRADRAREIIARLSTLGMPLDVDVVLQPGFADPTVAIGRPWIARALMANGHVASVGEAFERWLSRGQPAFVPRAAATPEDVIARIHDAHGLASMAHPGVVDRDEWIAPLAEAGLDALEVFHSEHDEAMTAKYGALARRMKLAATGGSDFHGDEQHGPASPGAVSLPREEFEQLKVRL
jgi:predicted metal-dependent phosphoesterase TrpH